MSYFALLGPGRHTKRGRSPRRFIATSTGGVEAPVISAPVNMHESVPATKPMRIEVKSVGVVGIGVKVFCSITHSKSLNYRSFGCVSPVPSQNTVDVDQRQVYRNQQLLTMELSGAAPAGMIAQDAEG